MATKRGIAMVSRVAQDKKGYVNGGKSDGNGIKDGRQRGQCVKGGRRATATRVMATAMAMMWAMVTAMRLVGNKEVKDKGGKGNGNGNEGGRQ